MNMLISYTNHEVSIYTRFNISVGTNLFDCFNNSQHLLQVFSEEKL